MVLEPLSPHLQRTLASRLLGGSLSFREELSCIARALRGKTLLCAVLEFGTTTSVANPGYALRRKDLSLQTRPLSIAAGASWRGNCSPRFTTAFYGPDFGRDLSFYTTSSKVLVWSVVRTFVLFIAGCLGRCWNLYVKEDPEESSRYCYAHPDFRPCPHLGLFVLPDSNGPQSSTLCLCCFIAQSSL
jgi:hypothetical protein